MHCWLVFKQFDLHSAKALKVVGLKLKAGMLTTYNYFRRDKDKTAIFLTQMLVLCYFLTLFSSKDLLRKR